MSEPFLGEIRVFSFNFAPKGWAMCQGQLMPISQNTALFSLLGTFYGGNGTSNFALPNSINSVLIGLSNAFPIGMVGGEINHTLLNSELPNHIHSFAASNVAGAVPDAAGNFYGASGTDKIYVATGTQASAPDVLQPTGGSQPHNNMQPCLSMTMCIALQGIFPTRN